MPIPVTAQDTEALKAALLSRGMLADRGRYTPFASNAGDANTQDVTAGAPVSLQSAVAGRAASGGVSSSASPDAANTNNAVPDEAQLDNLGESDALKYLVGLGLAGTALTAYLLRRRARLNQPIDDIPLVEGEDIGVAPRPRATGDTIVDGEVVERSTPITNTKRIAQGAHVPDNEGMKALGAPKEVDIPRLTKQNDITRVKDAPVSKLTAAQALAARAAKGQPNDVSTVQAGDALTDITPAERKQASSLVEQLRQRRIAGNKAQFNRKYGDRKLQSTLPTGEVDRESLLNIVIGLIRQGKMKPSTLSRIVR
jgi:hypothetical protein